MTTFFTPFTVWMEVIQLNMLAALPVFNVCKEKVYVNEKIEVRQ